MITQELISEQLAGFSIIYSNDELLLNSYFNIKFIRQSISMIFENLNRSTC